MLLGSMFVLCQDLWQQRLQQYHAVDADTRRTQDQLVKETCVCLPSHVGRLLLFANSLHTNACFVLDLPGCLQQTPQSSETAVWQNLHLRQEPQFRGFLPDVRIICARGEEWSAVRAPAVAPESVRVCTYKNVHVYMYMQICICIRTCTCICIWLCICI